MDESGHDGRGPYEVRGGVALPSDRVWKFTRRMRGLESRCFGDLLRNHGSELHGIKLMERRRLRLARSRPNFPDDERQALCRTYLGQGRNGQAPTLEMAIAYGQAGVLFVGKLLEFCSSVSCWISSRTTVVEFSRPSSLQARLHQSEVCHRRLFEETCVSSLSDSTTFWRRWNRMGYSSWMKRIERTTSASCPVLSATFRGTKLARLTPISSFRLRSSPRQRCRTRFKPPTS